LKSAVNLPPIASGSSDGLECGPMNLENYEFFQKLTQLPFVDAVWLYGSRARGVHQERADVDLAVVCPRASREQWLTVMDIIDDADTLLEIDCVRFDELPLNDRLRQNIIRDKRVLFERSKS
jgi:uncharacterized protein